MNKCSRYALNSNFDHDNAVKRVVRYLAETSDLKLRYESEKKLKKADREKQKEDLLKYIDSIFADCLNTKSFIFEYMFFL